MGNPEEGVRREYAAVRLDFDKRAKIFEDGLDALRQLWTTGKVNLDTEFFRYDDISFYSGTEMGPMMGAVAAADLGGQQPAAHRRHEAGR